MTLEREEKDALVAYRLQRAHETFTEVLGNVEMKYWSAAANRLYYACYYAVLALNLQKGITARTHGGVFGLFGKHFVVTGIISKEQNKLYRKLFDLRQSGDYDDWFEIEESDILPLVEPAKQFIATIENLIKNNPQ